MTQEEKDKAERIWRARVRIVCVNRDLILTMMNAVSAKSEALLLPVFKDLPEGYIIQAVSYSFERNCFMFQVHHESFEPVNEFDQIPFVESEVLTTEILYRKVESLA